MNIFAPFQKFFIRGLLMVAAGQTSAYFFNPPIFNFQQCVFFMVIFVGSSTLLTLFLDRYFPRRKDLYYD